MIKMAKPINISNDETTYKLCENEKYISKDALSISRRGKVKDTWKEKFLQAWLGTKYIYFEIGLIVFGFYYVSFYLMMGILFGYYMFKSLAYAYINPMPIMSMMTLAEVKGDDVKKDTWIAKIIRNTVGLPIYWFVDKVVARSEKMDLEEEEDDGREEE
jgi:hypothetical protein